MDTVERIQKRKIQTEIFVLEDTERKSELLIIIYIYRYIYIFIYVYVYIPLRTPLTDAV